MAEEIFSKKVPFWDVILFVIYSLPSIVALAFPFGSLVGALMTIGKLSSDNEILALQASGISLKRVFLPIFILGIGLSVVSFITNDYFLPIGNIRLGRIYRKILYTNPGVELEPYSIKRYEDTTIIAGNIRDNIIEDLIIIDRNKEKKKRIIMAGTALLEESKIQKGVVSLKLYDVFSHIPINKDQFEYTHSETMIYNILLKDISMAFINPGPREMSSLDVYKEMKVMEAKHDVQKIEHRHEIQKTFYNLVMEIRFQKDTNAVNLKAIEPLYTKYQNTKKRNIFDRNLQLYRLEYHKKFSIPASCLVFIIFAMPVGLMARRSGRTVGFGIGLLMSAFYWGLLFTGHTLGIRLEFSPLLAMWFPNLVMLVLGGALIGLRLRR